MKMANMESQFSSIFHEKEVQSDIPLMLYTHKQLMLLWFSFSTMFFAELKIFIFKISWFGSYLSFFLYKPNLYSRFRSQKLMIYMFVVKHCIEDYGTTVSSCIACTQKASLLNAVSSVLYTKFLVLRIFAGQNPSTFPFRRQGSSSSSFKWIAGKTISPFLQYSNLWFIIWWLDVLHWRN